MPRWRRTSAEAVADEPSAPAPPSVGPGHNLGVADGAASREVTATVVRAGGPTVDVALGPVECMSRLSEAHPDVVVLALQAGGLSPNLALLDLLRADAEPAVAMVRTVLIADPGEGNDVWWEVGIDSFLVRPFTEAELLGDIDALLQHPADELAAHRGRRLSP
jgi:CheY-like chemotaxis protein